MSQLEPDELARLLTQAVEPIRAAPEGYQRIRAGIERRRRLRLPLYALAGVAAAAVFALVALVVQPRQSTHVVEPAGPINGSVGGSGPDGLLTPTSGARPGSGGGPVGGSTGTSPEPVAPRTPSPGSVPTGAATANPTASATRPWGGSPTMPAPAAVPARNGDIDGDGVGDTVAMAGAGLEITLSRGEATIVPMPLPITPLRYTVADVNGDGYGEIIVRTSTAGGVDHYRMFRLMAADLIIPVDVGGGTPLDAGIDTGSGNASGFRCTGSGLISYSGTSAGGTYTVDSQPWRLTDTELVAEAGGGTTSTADTSLFRPDCGTL